MLPKQNRLQSDWSVKKALRRGRRLGTRYFKVSALKRRRGQHNRFAFIVSLKVSKKAVDRNRLKRRAREAIRKILPETKPAYDFAVNMFPPALKLTQKELEKEFIKAFQRGNYLSR